MKIQKIPNDIIESILTNMRHIIGNAEYLKCTTDEQGLYYVPLEA